MAVTTTSALGWLEPLQGRTLDLIQHLGGQRFPPEVVIVAIDEAAFEKLGARQPIPRGYLARASADSKVSDVATRDFMVAFHRALSPVGRVGALQQAELTLLQVPATAHPYYWAPFLLLGAR